MMGIKDLSFKASKGEDSLVTNIVKMINGRNNAI